MASRWDVILLRRGDPALAVPAWPRRATTVSARWKGRFHGGEEAYDVVVVLAGTYCATSARDPVAGRRTIPSHSPEPERSKRDPCGIERQERSAGENPHRAGIALSKSSSNSAPSSTRCGHIFQRRGRVPYVLGRVQRHGLAGVARVIVRG